MTLAPTTLEALGAAVAAASGPLRVAGAGTKAGDAAPDGAGLLCTTGLRGITAYDPAECVVTALAGTPVAEITAALAAHGQYLPFDPPLGGAGATLGGLVASGWSGPGRYRYGGIRDFVIGVRVVDGEGRLVASGGQVVKNAAGFLLHHALVGSAGRFGAIAEVSLKVFPRPETRATVVVRSATLDDALAAHERVRAANLDLEALDLDASAQTVWVRVAGAADAVPAIADAVCRAAGASAEVRWADDDTRAWADQAVHHLDRAASVKVPAAPSRLAAVLERLRPFGPCRASAGGAAVFLGTDAPIGDVDASLAARGWRGGVVRGVEAGRPLGADRGGAFHARVRATLDPRRRFC